MEWRDGGREGGREGGIGYAGREAGMSRVLGLKAESGDTHGRAGFVRGQSEGAGLAVHEADW
ncbi:hypothetical protein E2C01_096063 [Portunus trituberculatus]|uniref:Uncharacterized protein n=1 Tax=Portunus trituberculatus TaxID=210409 RepID=A0A5B7JRP3_PORTR|nr:hypothetical protein [Portunus trituberculatus]